MQPHGGWTVNHADESPPGAPAPLSFDEQTSFPMTTQRAGALAGIEILVVDDDLDSVEAVASLLQTARGGGVDGGRSRSRAPLVALPSRRTLPE
jgi:hypothetical protein